MARFDPATVKAAVLYAKKYGERAMTVRDMVERSGALAGINASYFDEYERPLGYLKVKGREINDYIATAIVYSGLVGIKNGKVVIEHRDRFHPLHFDEAVQVGPRLVAEGKGTAGIQNTIDYKQKARRAGIATDRSGNIIVYITSPSSVEMNWKELRDVLLGPEEKGGINPCEVLNLDGGEIERLTTVKNIPKRLTHPVAYDFSRRKVEEGDRACPRCDLIMTVTEFQGVSIDLCPGCKGMWFDRYELGKAIGATDGMPKKDFDYDNFEVDKKEYQEITGKNQETGGLLNPYGGISNAPVESGCAGLTEPVVYTLADTAVNIILDLFRGK